jgi:hypothetical protein
MSDGEEQTPEAARDEVAAMNEDKDHPLHDPGHFKHLAAVDHLHSLLSVIDDRPAEQRDATGQHSTADLEDIMAPALEPVATPEGFSFDAFEVPEGVEWDYEQEDAFREIFHNAQLSQGEADQMMTIASGSSPVDAQKTEAVFQSRYRGDSERMQRDIATARAVVLEIGGQPLADWLNRTGFGDHIAFFDLALRKGKQMGAV